MATGNQVYREGMLTPDKFAEWKERAIDVALDEQVFDLAREGLIATRHEDGILGGLPLRVGPNPPLRDQFKVRRVNPSAWVAETPTGTSDPLPLKSAVDFVFRSYGKVRFSRKSVGQADPED